jgi:hypothetical protein
MLPQEAGIKNFRLKISLQGKRPLSNITNALQLAFGICKQWEKIIVIDTSGNTNLCHRMGKFKVLPLSPPYSTEKFETAIDTCLASQPAVIIIEDFSNEWAGPGGILDVHQHMEGNAFYNWNGLSPRHDSLVAKVLQSQVHMMVTLRTKLTYREVMKGNKKGYEPNGTKAIQRKEFTKDYTLALELNDIDACTVLHDHTGVLNATNSSRITNDTGSLLSRWCNGNKPDTITNPLQAQVEKQIQECKTVDELLDLYNKHPELQAILKDQFTKKRESLQIAA